MHVSWFETGADPAVLWTRRVRFDALLLLLLFVVMLDRLTGNVAHEALGFAMLAVTVLHLELNRRWYMRLVGIHPDKSAGRQGRPRRPETVRSGIVKLVNVLLGLSFGASVVSGAMCSQTLLAGVTPDLWRMDLAYRAAHVGCSMWFFVLAGVHVGLHMSVYAGLLPEAAKRLPSGVLLGVAGVVSAVVSVRAWVPREADLLFGFRNAFIPVARDEWAVTMPIDLLACFLLAAVAVRWLDRMVVTRASRRASVIKPSVVRPASSPMTNDG